MASFVYNVEPRYTGGSPAGVDEATALRVALQERDSYLYIIKGFEGDERKERANKLGLSFIVFEMCERPKGWVVHDLITEEWHWWPFKADCPLCKHKNVECRRGVLNEHMWPKAERYTICHVKPPTNYVGKQLHNEQANYRYNGK